MAKRREQLLQELEAETRKNTIEGVFFFQAVAERSGMNLTDLQCISILTSTGPITAGQLAEMTGLTTGAITGVINRLEREGYVRREKDPGDGRRVILQPVLEELERAGAGFFGSQDSAMEALTSEYDDRDLAMIVDLMRKATAITQEETARIRAAASSADEGDLTAPLGSVENGRLVFANGASRLTLRAGTGMHELYRASFEGTAPKVTVEDGKVTFRYSKRFRLLDWRSYPGEVTLNPAVPWAIEVRGGAHETYADLSGLELTSFLLTAGVSGLTLALPKPSGMVPVRLSGGAHKLSIGRPAGVEARLSVKGGAATLTFDQQRFDGLGGKVQLQSPGYDEATDRYEIDVSGGAYEISVSTG